MDTVSKQKRSYIMSRVRGKDTKPEIALRKYLWSKGTRGYRLRVKLPGTPDIYFPIAKVAVFVEGCFWHKCPRCFRAPKSNRKYWNQKITNNLIRDERVRNALNHRGISYVTIWEHQVWHNIIQCHERISRKISKIR